MSATTHICLLLCANLAFKIIGLFVNLIVRIHVLLHISQIKILAYISTVPATKNFLSSDKLKHEICGNVLFIEASNLMNSYLRAFFF